MSGTRFSLRDVRQFGSRFRFYPMRKHSRRRNGCVEAPVDACSDFHEDAVKTIHRVVTTTVGALIIATWGVPTASAACIDLSPLPKRLVLGAGDRSPSFSPPGAIAASASGRSSDERTSIVGMWHVTFASDGNDAAPFFIPDGATLDDGYAQWHADGTEIMNSSRDPATSSFCLGVWRRDGGRRYKLNHLALSWDNTGALCAPQPGATSCMVGPTNIREAITVDSGGSTYSGSVTIEQYDTSGHVLVRLRGLVSAQRITPN